MSLNSVSRRILAAFSFIYFIHAIGLTKKTLDYFRHDIATICVLKMWYNHNQPTSLDRCDHLPCVINNFNDGNRIIHYAVCTDAT